MIDIPLSDGRPVCGTVDVIKYQLFLILIRVTDGWIFCRHALALGIPPREFNASGRDGPPKSVILSPEKRVNLSFPSIGLLLKNALVSSMPYRIPAMTEMEIAVDQKLCSTIVSTAVASSGLF